jgi:hypothetical protein
VHGVEFLLVKSGGIYSNQSAVESTDYEKLGLEFPILYKARISFQAYMVFKGHGKSEESSSVITKPPAARFLPKPRSGNSQCALSTNSSTVGIQEYARLTEKDVQVCFKMQVIAGMFSSGRAWLYHNLPVHSMIGTGW